MSSANSDPLISYSLAGAERAKAERRPGAFGAIVLVERRLAEPMGGEAAEATAKRLRGRVLDQGAERIQTEFKVRWA